MNLSGLLPLLDTSITPALAAARGGGGARPVIGAPDSVKPALVAALAARHDAPILIVTGKAGHAESFADELAVWLGTGERIVIFPETDSVPYERATAGHEAEEERLDVLRRLREWQPGSAPPLIVAPVLALAQRTISPADLGRTSIEVGVGARLPMRALLADLERLGYAIEPLVEAVGQAARRGGIVDLFPPGAAQPLRLELLGDRVESLRAFDPATQRTTARLEHAQIGPAREAQIDPARVRDLRDQLDFDAVQHGLRPRFEEELDGLADGSRTDPGFYAPFLLDATLLNHLPAGSLVVVDEPGETSKLLAELDEQAAGSRAALEAQGMIPRGLPLPHAAHTEVLAALDQAAGRVELQRWATEATAGVVLPPFTPAQSHGGRLRAFLNDVAMQRRAGRRLVIVSQQSARLAELFDSEGLSAAVVDRLTPEMPAAGRSERIADGSGNAPLDGDHRPAAGGGGGNGRSATARRGRGNGGDRAERARAATNSSDGRLAPGTITLLHGSLGGGWTLDLPDGALMLITDREVFGFTKQRRVERKASRGREAFLSELSPGDLVVHVEHGIAKFARLTKRVVDGVEREYLELHYAEKDRLFVPADQLDRVSRYVGPSDHRPQLTRLSSGDWARAKERVRRAVTDLAQELLQLYAAREVKPGHAFPEDTVWQQEMEGAFPYVETADQLTALSEIKRDMERTRPMDRIVIGDVGYGKTELAIRAAFKAVMDGKQVAVLAPTTVLAQQHMQTFSERVSGFPVRVDVLSRFRSEAEQRRIAGDVAAGRIDILIGTHRILQKDITFKDLGLMVIDEEQRFGVGHKERLKQLRSEVDVLSLSATPIPRTLHMSLTGIRDMSTLETAPEERLPIKTFVSEFDERLIREAILRELDRGGQIYLVHNRVYNIELMAAKLREIVPEAEIGVGHGQMPDDTLEQVMVEFQQGRCDVLLCTTIIESGLDIPNVNTIIINQADRLGLSQLYQLRGRVGRGAHRAYAYLLYDRNHALSEVAQKRLQAIFEAQELGAGFQIALKDLEIRGAGNLLGAEQSGHIGAIGYDLYSEMLGEAVKRLRAFQQGEIPPPPAPPPVTVDLPLTAHIPEPYIPDLNLRLAIYQRLASVTDVEALDGITAELTDRFGPPPPVVERLVDVIRIRLLARSAGLQSITTEEGVIVLRAAGPIAGRERLTGLSEAITTGSAQIRIEQRRDWRDLLLAVLTRLQPNWTPSTTNATPDYGTFAPGESGPRVRPRSGPAGGRIVRRG